MKRSRISRRYLPCTPRTLEIIQRPSPHQLTEWTLEDQTHQNLLSWGISLLGLREPLQCGPRVYQGLVIPIVSDHITFSKSWSRRGKHNTLEGLPWAGWAGDGVWFFVRKNWHDITHPLIHWSIHCQVAAFFTCHGAQAKPARTWFVSRVSLWYRGFKSSLCYEVEANASSLTEFRSMIKKAIWDGFFNHWDSQFPHYPPLFMSCLVCGVPSRWQHDLFFHDLFLEQELTNRQKLCHLCGAWLSQLLRNTIQPPLGLSETPLLISESFVVCYKVAILVCYGWKDMKRQREKTRYLLQHDSAWLQGTLRYYKVRVIVSRGLSWSTGVFWGAAQAITHAWADSTDTAKSLLWLSCSRFVTINFNRQTLHQRGRWASPTFWLTFVVSVWASLG